jgi:hypothetical protein
LKSADYERQYELYEYDGLLFLTGELSDKAIAALQSSATTSEAPVVDVHANMIEITYSGRDSNRWVVLWLKGLAETVDNASGEVTCTITTDEGEPLFEFFRIVNGLLIRQRGHIVRGEPEPVF